MSKAITKYIKRTLESIIPLMLLTAIINVVSFAIDPNTSATSATKNLDVSATIQDALRLELNKTLVSIDLTPNSTGVFQTGDVDVTASTTNSTGYILRYVLRQRP